MSKLVLFENTIYGYDLDKDVIVTCQSIATTGCFEATPQPHVTSVYFDTGERFTKDQLRKKAQKLYDTMFADDTHVDINEPTCDNDANTSQEKPTMKQRDIHLFLSTDMVKDTYGYNAILDGYGYDFANDEVISFKKDANGIPLSKKKNSYSLTLTAGCGTGSVRHVDIKEKAEELRKREEESRNKNKNQRVIKFTNIDRVQETYYDNVNVYSVGLHGYGYNMVTDEVISFKKHPNGVALSKSKGSYAIDGHTVRHRDIRDYAIAKRDERVADTKPQQKVRDIVKFDFENPDERRKFLKWVNATNKPRWLWVFTPHNHASGYGYDFTNDEVISFYKDKNGFPLKKGTNYSFNSYGICHEDVVEMATVYREWYTSAPPATASTETLNPFDLEKAKAGAELRTSDNRKVRIVAYDASVYGSYKLMCLVSKADGTEFVIYADEDGNSIQGSEYNLHLVSKAERRWLLVPETTQTQSENLLDVMTSLTTNDGKTKFVAIEVTVVDGKIVG